jgi:phage head maturation protease
MSGSLQLFDKDDGVYFECIPPDVGWARDLVTSIKRQDISDMSFKFSARFHYERRGTDMVQAIDEGQLHEISVVTEGCYQSTNVFARSTEGALIVNGVTIEDALKSEEIARKAVKQDEKKFEEVMKRFESFQKTWI